MSDYIAPIFALSIVLIMATFALLFLLLIIQKRQHSEDMDAVLAQWNEERQQLLDRIQAPSFDHLKAAEVRVIKAQKEEPQERIELL